MNVIILEIEPGSLNLLESMLMKIPHINIIKKYTDPILMMEEMECFIVDVLLLEVEMRPIHGLDISEEVKANCPHIDIVFMASNSKFALQAFDANAIDYLLKPVSLKRLQQTVQKIRRKKERFNIVMNCANSSMRECNN